MAKKVSIVGAGNVGGACGQRIWQRGIADVVLLDIVEGLPQSKAVDLMHSSPILGINKQITGTNKYEDTANSDVVILVSKGIPPAPNTVNPQTPKLTGRASGVVNNAPGVKLNVELVLQYSPNCIFIVVTNPVDVMSWYVHYLSKLPKNSVMGMAGMLDTSRMRRIIATELNVSVDCVNACIIGEHGNNMVPIPRLTTVGSVPITDILTEDKIQQIIDRTKKAASEVVRWGTKTNTPYLAPAMAAADMAEAIILDKKSVMPVSAYLDGEYGITGLFLGVPAQIGSKGVERVYEIKITSDENKLLQQAASAVREMVGYLNLS